MAKHEIKLAIQPEAWRMFYLRKHDSAFVKFSEKVFARDNNTCQFCGFTSTLFREAVNLDQNYNNNTLGNMVTACPFCAQCFFVESAGKQDYGGGVLIYLPDMSQTDLNGLCHALFCAMSSGSEYSLDAQSVYRDLSLRSQMVDAQFGHGMSDPMAFAHMWLETGVEKQHAGGASVLDNLRLLPSRSKFKTQIDAWSSSAIEELAKIAKS